MNTASLAVLMQIAFGLALFAQAALLLLTPKAGVGRPGALLLLAAIAEALWALTYLLLALGVDSVNGYLLAAETVRTSAWALFLLSLLGTLESGSTSKAWLDPTSNRFVVSVLLLAAAGGFWLARASLPDNILVSLSLVLTIATLVLLEQVWRNTAPGRRWALKFIGIALLLKLGLDLLIFSDALLFGRLQAQTWAVRGFASALLVPLIAVAAVRNREWRLDLGISRHVIFYSATLLISGTFLVVVAVGGYILRLFGGSWGVVATGTFVFAAVASALVTISSGAMRARLRVFIAKNFFSYRYNYRDEWLTLARLMGSPESQPNQNDPNDTLARRAIEAIGSLVESTGGTIWLVRAGPGGNYACEAMLNRATLPAPLADDDPLIHFCRTHDTVIDLHADAPNNPNWSAALLPAVIADDADAVLIVPLRVEDELLGLVMLDRLRINYPMNWEVYDMLKIAARQVASYLAVRRSTEALVMAEEFDTFNRMSAFVVHDLKNQVSQLSMVLSGADKHGDDPAYQKDVIQTVREVFQQMQDLLLQLRSGTPSQGSASQQVNLASALNAVIQQRRRPDLEPELTIDPAVADATVSTDRERFERAIGNLVQNAIEATDAGGKIQVQVKASAKTDRVVIEVTDTGEGMTESFIRTRLFKPFTSTKQAGMGIGAFETSEFIRQLGGTLNVSSRPGEGTSFMIELPLSRNND